MKKIEVVKHQGIQIIHTDLSNLSTKEAIEIMRQSSDVVVKYPEKSLYSLIDLKGAHFNNELIDAAKQILKKNTPHIIATSVIGLTPLTRLIGNSIIKFTKREAKFLDHSEEAKAWFLEHYEKNSQ